MASLAEVIRRRRSTGQSRTGSLFGSLKDKLKESIDPRQLLDQSGIITSLFPSLRAFKSTGSSKDIGKKIQSKSLELQSGTGEQNSYNFSAIEKYTEISAKNSMALPRLAEDVGTFRSNFQTLIEVMGQKSENKPISFFERSKKGESEYEASFKKGSRVDNKGLISDTSEEEKSKSFIGKLISIIATLISTVVGTITKLLGSLFSVIKGLIVGLIRVLTNQIVGIVTSLTKLIGTLIVKLLKSVTKVFSLLGRAGFLKLIGTVLSNPAGIALLTGLIISYLIKLAFLRDEDRKKLFQQLHERVMTGDATEYEEKTYSDLRAKGYKTEQEEARESFKPTEAAKRQFREVLNQKPGTPEYQSDAELVKMFDADRSTISEWYRAGGTESLDEVEDRLTNPSLQADPLGEQISPSVQVNEQGQAYDRGIDGPLISKAPQFADSARGLITTASVPSMKTSLLDSLTPNVSSMKTSLLDSISKPNVASATNLLTNAKKTDSGVDVTNIENGTQTGSSPANEYEEFQSLPSVTNEYYPAYY